METETSIDTESEKTVFNESNSITPSSFPMYVKYIYSDGTIDGVNNIQITVKRTDLIAEVKQKYIDSGKCISPDYIVLYYKGKELNDHTTVMENDLRENSTVFHKYTNITPFSKVDYKELAKNIHDEAIKNKYFLFNRITFRDYVHAGFDPVYGVWDQQWDKGNEWQTYPTVMVPDQEEGTSLFSKSNLVRNRSALIPQTQPFNPQSKEYTERLFKSMYVSLVGGFYFEVIHRMEGKWSGTNILSTTPSDQPVTTCDLRYDPHGYWLETRNSIDYTGLVNTYTLKYTPVGNGRLRVDLSDAMYANCRVELVETSPYLLVITAVDNYTGKPKLVETFTIVDNMNRVHTIQDFSAGGNVTELYAIKEERIVDPSASSIAPYDMMKGKPEVI